MKKVLLFVALVLSCAMYGFAQQDNEKISYQAVVRDNENHLVYNRNLSVTVAIANSANARVVFTERHEDVKSNANGLISLLIGNGNRLSGRWEDVRWNTAVVTATIVDASTTETLAVHVLPLQAVPYALYANYADSTNMQPIRNELADTAAAIRNSISATANDGKLTIRRNGQDLGIFTADQAGNTDVDILVPEKISDLVNDSRFADTTADNHFTGDNRFTGHNAVTERGFYLDGNNPTTASNCQVMVNACDLLALFDSMQNRINGVKDSLNGRIDSLLGVLNDIMNSVPPTFNSLTVDDITTESIKATATFTAAGAPISSYQFCISKNADMSNPVGCYTSDVNVYTFTGLDPYTIYYITASGTNLAGTANSDVVSGRTLAHAPTAAITVGQHKPTGFVVNIGSLDFQEAANGTVQICYKQKEGNDCPVDATEVYADYTNCVTKENVASSTDIAEIISENIELDKDHCVIVKVSNEDSTTVYGPFSVTPSDITLTVTGTESVTYQCGTADVTPEYTATLSAGENADDYTFVWTYGNKKDTVGTTYTPVLTESTTVTCTATHNTENFSLSGSVDVTVVNQGTVPVIALCVNNLTVTDKGSTDIAFVKWDDNGTFETTTTVTHNYTTAGEYTITAESADGCTATRTVTVTEGTFRPCEVPATHSVQMDVVGGVETAENGKIVSVSDREENIYSVVQIGNQCWMAENLRATQYSDGTAIPAGTVASTTAAYRYAPNGDQDNVPEYGYLYNWQAATRGQSSNSNSGKGVQGACPTGWHIPTNADWTAMETEVNGAPVTYQNQLNYGGTHGGMLATGCAWKDTTVARAPGNYTFADRNASGFGALPAGRFTNMGYYNFNYEAEFWSCTTNGGGDAYHRALRYDIPGMGKSEIPIQYAFSVRCVRDEIVPTEMSMSADKQSVSFCPEGSDVVNYSVEVTEFGSLVSGYTYVWSIEPENANNTVTPSNDGSECAVTYGAAGSYTVKCTASKSGIVLEKSKTTTASLLSAPTFTVCEDELVVTLKGISGAATVQWEATANPVTIPSGVTSLSHEYAAGDYTVTVTGSGTTGCSVQAQGTLTAPTLHPCQVASLNSNNEIGSGTTLDSVADIDGNKYLVVQIGSQCWMAENLRVTKYADGTPVTLTTSVTSSSVAYRYNPCPNNLPVDVNEYGFLYNWKAAMGGTTTAGTQGICPDGWHLPTTAEWNTMEESVNGGPIPAEVGGVSYRGSHAGMLARGCAWIESDVANAPGNYSYADRNISGFGAVPAGRFTTQANPFGGAAFWTSSSSSGEGVIRQLISGDDGVSRGTFNKAWGLSVRCVRNAE